MNQGTPLTLKQAIGNGSGDTEDIKNHVRDFLAQKFTVAFMNANTDQEIALRALWNMIVVEVSE